MIGGPLDVETVRAGLTTRWIGRRLVYRSGTVSTMIDAAGEAKRGAPEGTVVIAEEQSAGRGRLQRTWLAPAGSSVLLSVVLRPDVEGLQRLSIIVAVALVRAIEAVSGRPAAIKWPNDVLLGGRKVSGILIESHLHGESVDFAVVGVGINVNFDPTAFEEIAETATSLSAVTGGEMSREVVLLAFLHQLEACYLAPEDEIRREWVGRLATLGKAVNASYGRTVEEGIAEAVDEDGALILRRNDGSRVRITAGDVTLRRPTEGSTPTY
jgi:BirA family transcriptional regulator, biotin operon repressor / biotin---[acetyl-CoA-carboxylase] ligase